MQSTLRAREREKERKREGKTKINNCFMVLILDGNAEHVVVHEEKKVFSEKKKSDLRLLSTNQCPRLIK